jgi:bifunctional non-homologous end joining protein LigD
LLSALLVGASQRILYAEHLEGDGVEICQRACAMRLEGVVSKTAGRALSLRTDGKLDQGQVRQARRIPDRGLHREARGQAAKDRLVPRRSPRRHLLLYAGKVRSGYTEPVARDVRERLAPFTRKDSPLSEPVTKPKATWVEPVIDPEIANSTMTENALLREAVFKRLREDREWPAAPG